MRITNTNILLAPVLITEVISELVLNRESYLIFEGRLRKADGTPYVNADEIGLTNNAMVLF